VPAPWLQIKLLKILALLGADDRSVSEAMYEVLRDAMRRADIQSTIAYGVLACIFVSSTQRCRVGSRRQWGDSGDVRVCFDKRGHLPKLTAG
jgi:hypothetical protein